MNFFKHTTILTAIILLTVASGCTQKENDTTPNNNTEPSVEDIVNSVPDPSLKDIKIDTSDYNKENVGITNTLEWEKIEDVYGALVVFRQPKKDAETFSSNISLSTETFDAEEISEYANLASQQLETILLQFTKLDEQETNFLGKNAYSITYEFQQTPEQKLQGRQTYFINDDQIYIVTFTSLTENFEQDYTQAIKIINTLTFL